MARTHPGHLPTYCWPRLSDMRRNEHQEAELPVRDSDFTASDSSNACLILLCNFVRCFAFTSRHSRVAKTHHRRHLRPYTYVSTVHGDMAPATPRPFLALPFHLADSVQSQSTESHNHQSRTITRPLTITRPSQSHFRSGCSRSNTSHRVLGFPHFWSPVVC